MLGDSCERVALLCLASLLVLLPYRSASAVERQPPGEFDQIALQAFQGETHFPSHQLEIVNTSIAHCRRPE
jgi:hypothetical protein